MASVNKVILIGNLGSDPDLRTLPNGGQVCEFRMATTDAYTDRNGQRQEQTEWHRIVVFGKQAEPCHRYLNKGRPCYVEGRLRTRSWEDKNGGGKRFMTEIVADRVQFLGSGERRGASAGGGGGGGGGGGAQVSRGPESEPPMPDDFGPGQMGGGGGGGGTEDDIPF